MVYRSYGWFEVIYKSYFQKVFSKLKNHKISLANEKWKVKHSGRIQDLLCTCNTCIWFNLHAMQYSFKFYHNNNIKLVIDFPWLRRISVHYWYMHDKNVSSNCWISAEALKGTARKISVTRKTFYQKQYLNIAYL